VVAQLVLVSGPPGAGKTTLARRLASDLAFALLSKDTVKEALGDALPAETVAESQRLGAASVGVLFAVAREQLVHGASVVLEHTFPAEFASEVVPLVDLSRGARHVQCRAPDGVLTQRVLDRVNRGERHAVHQELQRAPIAGRDYTPMDLVDVPTLLVDTADGYRPDYPTVLDFVEAG